jgi:hypothetical protein
MMNERIRELAEQAEKYALDNVGKGYYGIEDLIYQFQFVDTKIEKFAELIVAKVLDEVATRAFVSGDRAWSDDVDRPWVELEFGIGKLAE